MLIYVPPVWNRSIYGRGKNHSPLQYPIFESASTQISPRTAPISDALNHRIRRLVYVSEKFSISNKAPLRRESELKIYKFFIGIPRSFSILLAGNRIKWAFRRCSTRMLRVITGSAGFANGSGFEECRLFAPTARLPGIIKGLSTVSGGGLLEHSVCKLVFCCPACNFVSWDFPRNITHC